MPKLSKKEEKLLRLAEKGGKDAELFLLDQIQELEEQIDELKKEHKEYFPKMMEMMTGKEIKFPEYPKSPEVQKIEIRGAEILTIKGDKGDDPTKEELLELIRPLIPKPIKGGDGHTPTEQELKKLIKPLIPEPIKGDIGDSPTKNEIEKIIKPLIPPPISGSPDTAEEVRKKLESLKGEDRLDKEAIRGLEDEIKGIKESMAGIARGRNMGRAKIQTIRAVDLTSQVDGVVTEFTLPMDTVNVLGVWGTQFPVTFRQTTDWTFAGRTLTLVTAQVGTPQSGQTLWALCEVLFYP